MKPLFVAILLILIFLLIIAIDVWLCIDNIPNNTFSSIIELWVAAWPPLRLILVFALGLLAGHLFWK